MSNPKKIKTVSHELKIDKLGREIVELKTEMKTLKEACLVQNEMLKQLNSMVQERKFNI